MRKLFALVFGLGSAIGAHGQTNIEFQEYDLENGLHVILHEDHTTPIVAVSVLYHVGSKNEKPGRSGFAHFFEHLMFEGSPNIERGDFMKIVQNNGGALNANTSFDRTFYYEILPANQLELGLWLESERMLQATVDITGVETQREVVKEEKRLRIDNQPYMSFQAEMFGKAFEGSPYAITPIGTMEDLNAAQIADFKDFYETFYVPNNATLSIAGDIDPKEAKEMIEKYFGPIAKGTNEIPRPKPELKLLNNAIVDTVYDNIQLPALFLGYKIPQQGTKDAYAMDMLTTLLSGGQSSRLYKKLVDQDQLGLAVQAFPYGLENGGIFITLGIANMGVDLKDLKAGIDGEFSKVRNDLISENEYQKVLNQLENDFVSQNSTMAGIAESLANYHVYFSDANLINTEIEKYREVTREDLQAAAQKYLTDQNRVILYYLPKQQ
ncbi:putative Zn-dependent peptidase [Owenweeksia hongkongensis DSM 17368]|uniref:Putative Zn-dependent peptidase n=1 Tax=Owenweeksia hongkongensis (strain DSM 17368 / CIP 108786 / JCM 12287 / NRRL B-23963 / UST20020801) TaxID=926562 RepID=G8R002_OWEHD|nr:pitrilysin family protein [Owenweeksia hongkongensis]AEV32642.1 putative Zn-dependent peptidase [Owenweeksia hongkongensis DSM 17368]